MEDLARSPLAGWESFYVIIGSSAAALTGLQFVVIALNSEARTTPAEGAMRAFATPTVVNFCAVLLLSAILTTPHQTAVSLSVCVTACGVAGLFQAIRVAYHTQRQSDYAPEVSDWIWHVVLPIGAYAALLGAGIVAAGRLEPALYVVGASALLLLFIGIHNAWDSAVYLVSRPRPQAPQSEAPRLDASRADAPRAEGTQPEAS